jgi:hypothetical protein
MKRIIVFSLLAAAVVSCNKDKFQTKPQIKIKSTNYEDVVPRTGTLRITLEFTDKEGDVSDSILIVRERLNIKSPVVPPLLPYKIPSFPNSKQGEIQVDLDYDFGLTTGLLPIPVPGSTPQQNEPDTMTLKFVVRDKAGNKSDTAFLGIIVNR